MSFEPPIESVVDILSHVDDDRPDPPIHLSAEAAYGWECGWSAAVAAMRAELGVEG